ncbi:major facilitator superfamily domain-containing protein [Xylaria bambusicola]|uniref:major facilitator superfamily domain-containing protein n=1 Tax=Xylaria bambusicola TaxID=326684 RepID=UPI002007662E|nr:major facilitator superfamily domain-containing protein [Xylaria bambusicola]KAI0509274.1 major facilitator superfamily domain-containing protein [Xylaria bambusicola]
MEMLPEPMSPLTYERTYGGNRAFHNFFNDFSHIQDPNLRRRLALSEIDKIPFGLYHVRAVLVAGVGFFLDSYDIFAINLVTLLLGVVFWQGPPNDAVHGYGGNHGVLPTSVSQTLKTSTSAGIVIGQLVFGWLADKYGRRKMYGVELGIILVSTLSCCLIAASQAVSFTGILTFWRVMMGIGIGGDYPLSSVITSEFAPTRWRGAMMAAVFSMQGIGQLAAAIVALIVTASFAPIFQTAASVDQCDYDCQTAADRCWRIIIDYRITIPETPRYTFEVAKDVEKAAADIKAYMANQSEGEVDEIKQARMKKVAAPALAIPAASWRDAYGYFSQWKNGKVLIGTTLSWFFLDFAFYGLGLNNQVILSAIGYADGNSLHAILHNSAVGTIILIVAGSLPGYWTSIFLIDTIGRKPLQILGFSILTIIFSVLGFCYYQLNKGSLLALYVVANYFFNFGPNTTTFIIPGECYPTRYRSTGHGISAAMGKVGAILAQVISIPLLKKGAPPTCKGTQCQPWIDKLMQIFALFMLLGLIVSFLVPETKGYTLEELAGERSTSYNSGRNGSIVEIPRKWWNPFNGGRPAGFMYPQSSQGSFGRGGRVGIMTSPELIAENAEARKRHFWRWGREDVNRRRPNSTSSTTFIADSSINETAITPPRWGAGWGRIDRGGQPPPMENIRLQDVGQLLDN